MTERDFATDVVRRLRSAGFVALFAGGCVRDALLGFEPTDYDVATSATPEQVQGLFRRTFAIGASFGVIEVVGPKPHKVQVATFRSDGVYSDGRRPDAVTYSSPEEDAARRDFTINGMFFDPIDGQIIDYVGGQADIERGWLRAIGDPRQRFKEDRLRLLRAVRFAQRFNLIIEAETWFALGELASTVVNVSGERIAEELRKMLAHSSRRDAARLLHSLGLWSAILPESPRPAETDWNGVDEVTFPLVLSAMAGPLSAPQWNAVADRLKLSNHDRERLQWLADGRGQFPYLLKAPPHVWKPLLAHPGAADLIVLARAIGEQNIANDLAHKLATTPRVELDPPPLLTGADLIAMGLPPGPRFKEILDQVRRKQLDADLTDRVAALISIERTNVKP